MVNSFVPDQDRFLSAWISDLQIQEKRHLECQYKLYIWLGFAAVWHGLESAAKDITTNVAAETVTTIKHK